MKLLNYFKKQTHFPLPFIRVIPVVPAASISPAWGNLKAASRKTKVQSSSCLGAFISPRRLHARCQTEKSKGCSYGDKSKEQWYIFSQIKNLSLNSRNLTVLGGIWTEKFLVYKKEKHLHMHVKKGSICAKTTSQQRKMLHSSLTAELQFYLSLVKMEPCSEPVADLILQLCACFQPSTCFYQSYHVAILKCICLWCTGKSESLQCGSHRSSWISIQPHV